MEQVEDIECLIPAAGRSERMGRWKLVLPFGNSTIIETVVRNALEVCARVLLVTGYRASEMAALFRLETRITVVSNPVWESGMFSSIQHGVAHVSTERFFITLGDKPYIQPSVYRALLASLPAAPPRSSSAAAQASPSPSIVFPVFKGRRGHPVLLHERVKEAVLAADATTGSMRDVITRFSVTELPWDDDSILHDVDTKDDCQ